MSKQNVFDRITATILEKLEAGVLPWRKTWAEGNADNGLALPRNANSGRAYNGLNRLVLMIEALDKGYTSNLWITPNQCKKAGLDFRGTKTTEVIFWKRTERKVEKSDGSEETKRGMFAKSFRVLNLDQVKGDKSQFEKREAPRVEFTTPELAERIRDGLGLSALEHGGDRAFYAPSADLIKMPPVEAFECEGSYQATLLHEATHATGAKHRLDREFGARFGDERYAVEELVAELGAAFLSEVLGVEGDLIDNHASYLDHWVKVMKGDARAILTASSKAQAATDLILEALGVEDDHEAVADMDCAA